MNLYTTGYPWWPRLEALGRKAEELNALVVDVRFQQSGSELLQQALGARYLGLVEFGDVNADSAFRTVRPLPVALHAPWLGLVALDAHIKAMAVAPAAIILACSCHLVATCHRRNVLWYLHEQHRGDWILESEIFGQPSVVAPSVAPSPRQGELF